VGKTYGNFSFLSLRTHFIFLLLACGAKSTRSINLYFSESPNAKKIYTQKRIEGGHFQFLSGGQILLIDFIVRQAEIRVHNLLIRRLRDSVDVFLCR
jgi:hypothetical protein